MSNFRIFRNLELSTLQYVESEVNSNWSNVSVVKSFNEAKQRWTPKTPVVAVRTKDITPERKEIGSSDYKYYINVIIDIFGTSDANRLDLAAQITESLKSTWTYNEYSKDSGDMETLIATDSGNNMRTVDWLQNSKLEFSEDVAPVDKFRHIMSFNVTVY